MKTRKTEAVWSTIMCALFVVCNYLCRTHDAYTVFVHLETFDYGCRSFASLRLFICRRLS